jgi:hypothetical protein
VTDASCYPYSKGNDVFRLSGSRLCKSHVDDESVESKSKIEIEYLAAFVLSVIVPC